ncbi:MAG: DUF4331 domain-containing protein [Chloroflexi bacterium]|nr:MAG: DUF4331 domain-containing protein [Chloroflexota bacterium]
MADHLDAPGLMSPNMDARIDITDIYAFEAPDDASRSVLILNVNPLAPTLATAFNPDALYELKIDTNGDADADIAYRIRFSDDALGRQTAKVHRATGHAASGDNDGGQILINKAPADLVKTSGPDDHRGRWLQVFRRPAQRSLLLRSGGVSRIAAAQASARFHQPGQRLLRRQERVQHRALGSEGPAPWRQHRSRLLGALPCAGERRVDAERSDGPAGDQHRFQPWQ